MSNLKISPSAGPPRFVLRPVRRDEMDHWRTLMRQHHYLGFERIVGKSLCYVATNNETQWVALLGWGSAALKCAARDQWIGWDRALQFKRLHLIANNVRFLILPDWRIPNLASHLLALNLKRLSQDWQLYHGHPLLLAETFVDSARFAGTCYRAAGWQVLGSTQGYSKCNKGYWRNGHPKLLLVRPLVADASRHLRAPFLTPVGAPGKECTAMIDINQLPLQGHGGLMDLLKTVVDPRKPRGVRHPVVTVVAIAICAALSGARSFTAIAEWAETLSREALRKLGSKRPNPPSEPTIRRVLQSLNADLWDSQIGNWIVQHCPLAGRAVAADGKTLRGAHDAGQRPVHLLSAILHQEALVIGQMAVEEKTNEIPKLLELLAPLTLQGAVVTADALHTQHDTARYIVEKKQADYLFIVKDNQPTLRNDIATLNLSAFPPCTHHHR
jgi:hypothetical protein